jgi:hypothetical protein
MEFKIIKPFTFDKYYNKGEVINLYTKQLIKRLINNKYIIKNGISKSNNNSSKF